MRFIQRACTDRHQGSRCELCYRRDICTHFYRNAINIGLPIIECPQAAKEIEAGDEVEVNFDTGVITDVTKGTSYQGQAFPPFMQKIIDCEDWLTILTRNKMKMNE